MNKNKKIQFGNLFFINYKINLQVKIVLPPIFDENYIYLHINKNNNKNFKILKNILL